MRILVTGGAGFIGDHLCRYLLEQGNIVVAIDNLHSGSMENIEDLQKHRNFLFVKHDIREKKWPNILTVLKFAQIYHLACPASPVFYQKDPLYTIETCVIGTQHALEFAHKNKARFLITSTSEIYGEPLEHPQKEEYRGNVNTLGIRACYDESKRLSETITMEYKRVHNVDVRIVRIFNTYGPKMRLDDGRVVTNFIGQALRGEPLTVYGDGKQTRSFCFIDDMVLGLVKMMDSDITGPVNLGNPEECSILALAKLVIQLTESKSDIEFIPLPKDDPTKRCPDISRARELLDWEPVVFLTRGLQITIDHLKI